MRDPEPSGRGPGSDGRGGRDAPTFRARLRELDFDRAPFLVIWETTQACDLACRHCRAEAVPDRHPAELSTEEARALMSTVRRFGRPLFVLTGGDPLKRPDTVDLVRYGASIGLRMAMTPSGTPLMTEETIRRLKEAGLARLAVSLDGSRAEIHDAFRGVEGSWAWSVRMLRAARDLGLPTQVNTTVTRDSLDDFDALCELMEGLGIALWSVFFLVPTGRAKLEDVASPEAFEEVFGRMYELSKRAPFDIKSTAAPHYRRLVLQRRVEERRAARRKEREAGRAGAPPVATEGPAAAPGGQPPPPEARGRPEPFTSGIGFSLADGVGRAKGVNDGDGFLFVSHMGEIYPSGFLPLSAGNVRRDDLVEVYRDSTLFRQLRNRELLRGKCGVCEYRAVCGGSRARAYALTGDYLEAEPFCTHVPVRWRRMVEAGEAEPAEVYFTRRIRRRGVALPVMGGGEPEGRGSCGGRRARPSP